jgi:large subunit ribosomal protein L16
MLLPKRVKYRKQMRGRMTGDTKGGDYLAFGDYGLVAMEPAWIKSNQIEACRITMSRYFRRGGKIYIRIFPDKPVTKKPQEVRMGKGKGAVEYWVSVVKPGRVLFEVANVTEEQAKEAFRLAGHKLPIKVKMVAREVYDEAQ